MYFVNSWNSLACKACRVCERELVVMSRSLGSYIGAEGKANPEDMLCAVSCATLTDCSKKRTNLRLLNRVCIALMCKRVYETSWCVPYNVKMLF